MKKIILTLAISLCITLNSQSWINLYSDPTPNSTINFTNNAEVLVDNNQEIVNISTINDGSRSLIIVQKSNKNGRRIIWTRSYSVNLGNLSSSGGFIDRNNDIIILGNIDGFDAFFAKISNIDGNLLFSRVANNTRTDSENYNRGIQLNGNFNNDYILIGSSDGTRETNITRINSNTGEIIWKIRSINQSVSNGNAFIQNLRTAYSLCQVGNGDIIVAGAFYDGTFNPNTINGFSMPSINGGNGRAYPKIIRINPIDGSINGSLRFNVFINSNDPTCSNCFNSSIDNIINIPSTNEVIFTYHMNTLNYSPNSRGDYGIMRINLDNDNIIWNRRFSLNNNQRTNDIDLSENLNEIYVTFNETRPNTSDIMRSAIHRLNINNGEIINEISLKNINILRDFKTNTHNNNLLTSFRFNKNQRTYFGNALIDFDNLNCIDNNIATNINLNIDFEFDSLITTNALEEEDFDIIQNNIVFQDTFNCRNTCIFLGLENFTELNTTTVLDDIVYDGKYYVNGIITFSGEIVVDITNCDFVFNGCGSGLRFINGARLRANNSVFRPCNEDDFWNGIEIIGSLNNKIHECTFKNAVEAIQIVGLETDAVITNNLFQNNFRGILYNNTQSTGSIAGNTFDVNNANSEIPMACLNTSMQDISFNGIRVLNSNLLGDITQNRFIGQFNDNVNSMKGIVLESSNCDITLNSFTNQDIAIRFNNAFNSRAINILNNSIEYNRSNLINNSQIQIFNVNNTFRINNNNINQETILKNGNAIEVQNCTNGTMAENNIRNFNTGIFVNSTHSCVIKENEINNTRSNGIVASNSNSTFIGCNIINLITSSTDGALGIAVVNFDQSPSVNSSPTRVLSNCIFDSRVGLYVSKPSGGPFTIVTQGIPDIRNNFIYNYRDRGMDFLNITGSVGNSSNPGKNTLYSNINSALDVVSSGGVITMFNNFITAPVNMGSVTIIGPLLTHHSNASCANQINKWNKDNAIDLLMKCEGNAVNNGNILNGDFIISSGGIDGAFEAKTLDKLIAFNPSNYHLIVSNKQYNNLTINEKKWLEYQYNFNSKDYTSAKEVIKSINHKSDDELIKIRLYLEYLQNLTEFKNSPFALNYKSDSIYTHLSNSILNLSNQNAFEIDNKQEFEYTPSSLVNLKMFDSRSAIKIYPNPTKEIVNIDYFNSNSENTQISIIDINGKTVYENSYSNTNITINLNVSQFLKGIYIINIKNNTENITSKIVVQ